MIEETWITKAGHFPRISPRELRKRWTNGATDLLPSWQGFPLTFYTAHKTRGLCYHCAHHATIKGYNPPSRILICFSSRLFLISRAFQLFYHTPLGFSVEQTFGSTISRYDSILKRRFLSASSIAFVPLPSWTRRDGVLRISLFLHLFSSSESS